MFTWGLPRAVALLESFPGTGHHHHWAMAWMYRGCTHVALGDQGQCGGSSSARLLPARARQHLGGKGREISQREKLYVPGKGTHTPPVPASTQSLALSHRLQISQAHRSATSPCTSTNLSGRVLVASVPLPATWRWARLVLPLVTAPRVVAWGPVNLHCRHLPPVPWSRGKIHLFCKDRVARQFSEMQEFQVQGSKLRQDAAATRRGPAPATAEKTSAASPCWLLGGDQQQLWYRVVPAMRQAPRQILLGPTMWVAPRLVRVGPGEGGLSPHHSLLLPSSLYDVWGVVTVVKSAGDIDSVAEEPPSPHRMLNDHFSETPPDTHRLLSIL